MEYKGKYEIFDVESIKTYSLESRPSEVHINDLIKVEDILSNPATFKSGELEELSDHIVKARKEGKPVIVFSGAHMIKNGMGPIYSDLMKRDLITAFGSNGAFTIHDFELAYTGKTSESIPNALSEGLFGFAEETNKYINEAISHGNSLKLGYGETMGRFISGEAFPNILDFKYPEASVQYNAFQNNVPFCAHCGIGNDIYHMTKYFDGEAVGGCSGRDFLVFANEISKLKDGGVCLLIGSAVIGVEVILKALSMSANIGKVPWGLVTASFDIREAELSAASNNDKTASSYYFRDIKSIVTRVPQSFKGKGYYIKGNHKETVPALYKLIVDKMG